MSKPCPFCHPEKFPEQIIRYATLSYAKWDQTPAAPGHALIIPERHVVSMFDLAAGEMLYLFRLLRDVRDVINEQFHPADYTIGINDGPAAGQTVGHLHIHLIPRYVGDVADPRGGIRRMFPDDPYIRQLGASST